MTETIHYRTLDPTTGELVESYPTAPDGEVEAALVGAVRAFGDWRRRPLTERTALLARAAELLEEEAGDLAQTMALEMGKVSAEGEAEAQKCAWVCRHYAEHAERYLRPEPMESDGSEAWVRFDPLGPILAVMPWNFPLWQVFRFAAPALAAGNVVVLKHAPSTPGCALAISRLLAAAGVPDGVFQSLFLTHEQAARAIAHPAVRGVTLTGSTRAGREVAKTAGASLKPMVMELGGSDPFIVFADADVRTAIEVGVRSRCLNNGQSCIAAKRFLVERDVFGRFTDALVSAMASRQVGDPRSPGAQIGPLAREDLRDTLARQVEACHSQGATVLTGGVVPEGDGFFYPPTVLTGLSPESPAAQEELFGPVAVVYPFAGEDEALRLANGTPYGLGASLWTRDPERVRRLVPEIDSGAVFVNGMVKSDPRLPFGGVKDSGFGRELARRGMLEFTNAKTVWIA